jgi:peptide/nickel transport system permease protein
MEGERLASPSASHLMGVDNLGRDVLSRIIYGGRIALIVAVSSVLISLSLGSLLGWISGYYGGLLDRTLSLLMDSLYSFPSIILAIIMVAILGPNLLNMIISIAVVYIPSFFRVVRGQVLQLKSQEFVEAAHALGAADLRIVLFHIAPNTINSMMAVSSFCIADAILTEAALSFLGFGLPPPTPDWGFDIHTGQKFLLSGKWWLITFPRADDRFPLARVRADRGGDQRSPQSEAEEETRLTIGRSCARISQRRRWCGEEEGCKTLKSLRR